MRKSVIWMAAALLALAMTACGSAKSASPSEGSEAGLEESQAAEDQAQQDSPAEESQAAPVSEGEHQPPSWRDDGLFEISTAQDLLDYAQVVLDEPGIMPDAILLDDIDLSTVCGPGIGTWYPIGYAINEDGSTQEEFYGCVFDGNGHTISGLYCEGLEKGGLIYWVQNGEVRDLTITNSSVYGSEEANGPAEYGLLAARMMYSCTVSNVTATDSCVVDVPNARKVGGLVGDAIKNGIVVEGCSSACKVTGGKYVGGICGEVEDGVVVKSCVNTGEVTGRAHVGGIAGGMDYVESASQSAPCRIIGCINYGTVSAHTEEEYDRVLASGVVGYNHGSEALFCVNVGEVQRLDDSGDINYRFGAYDDLGNGNNLQIGLSGEKEMPSTLLFEPGDPALTDGRALAALGEDYWTQGEQFPVWNGTMPQ